METDHELHRTHARDQARAALEQADDAERRALRHSGYPLWFWLTSGSGLAALPVSVRADGAAGDVVLLAGCGLLLATFLLGRRDRRVQEQCASLGARGWLREIAVFLPAIVVLDVAMMLANSQSAWALTVLGSALTLAAWVSTGILAGRVSSARTP